MLERVFTKTGRVRVSVCKDWACPIVLLKKRPADVPLVEFIYHVFTRMPGESYRWRLRSLLLCLCDVFRALINSLVC